MVPAWLVAASNSSYTQINITSMAGDQRLPLRLFKESRSARLACRFSLGWVANLGRGGPVPLRGGGRAKLLALAGWRAVDWCSRPNLSGRIADHARSLPVVLSCWRGMQNADRGPSRGVNNPALSDRTGHGLILGRKRHKPPNRRVFARTRGLVRNPARETRKPCWTRPRQRPLFGWGDGAVPDSR